MVIENRTDVESSRTIPERMFALGDPKRRLCQVLYSSDLPSSDTSIVNHLGKETKSQQTLDKSKPNLEIHTNIR